MQRENFLCKGLSAGEPDGSHYTYIKPEDELEVAAIKVETKKDKDVIRLEVNDFSQQNGLDPPKLSDLIDIEVNGEQVDYTSNLDQTGFHTAILFQYPKGSLEHDGAKRVADDIGAIFKVEKAASSSSLAVVSTPPPMNTVPYSGAVSGPQPLEDQLKTFYTLTQVRDDSTIVSRGSVLSVARDKVLLGTPAAKTTVCAATVTDGTPKPPASACLAPLKLSIAKHESTFLPAGQKLDLVGVSVNTSKETVALTLVDDSGSKAKYRTAINFVFPQGYLEGSDAGQVGEAVNGVLPLFDQTGTSQPIMSPVLASAPTAPRTRSTSAPASATDPAGQPKTVSLGMSEVEVQGALGAPNKVVDLGVKKILVYSDLKVTLMNGKVSDVQ